MKKLLTILLSAIITLSTVTCTVNTVFADDITVYINGTQLYTDVAPVMINDRVLVPMRAIFEILGATVTWNDDSQTATAIKNEKIVSITVNDPYLYENGTAFPLDVSAIIINDRTLVPIRAVSEVFDATVTWDEATQSVIIKSNETNTTDIPVPTLKPVPTNTPMPTLKPLPTATPDYTQAYQQDIVTLKNGICEMIDEVISNGEEIYNNTYNNAYNDALSNYNFNSSDSYASANAKRQVEALKPMFRQTAATAMLDYIVNSLENIQNFANEQVQQLQSIYGITGNVDFSDVKAYQTNRLNALFRAYNININL